MVVTVSKHYMFWHYIESATLAIICDHWNKDLTAISFISLKMALDQHVLARVRNRVKKVMNSLIREVKSFISMTLRGENWNRICLYNVLPRQP